MSILALVCMAIMALACGSEEEWMLDEDQTDQNVELTLGQESAELTVATQTRYECICDLSLNTCRGKFRFPEEKKSTCRYKRKLNGCVGACEGRCVNQNGSIKRGSEFKGICIKREVRPNGMYKETATDCHGQDIECTEDVDGSTTSSFGKNSGTVR